MGMFRDFLVTIAGGGYLVGKTIKDANATVRRVNAESAASAGKNTARQWALERAWVSSNKATRQDFFHLVGFPLEGESTLGAYIRDLAILEISIREKWVYSHRSTRVISPSQLAPGAEWAEKFAKWRRWVANCPGAMENEIPPYKYEYEWEYRNAVESAKRKWQYRRAVCDHMGVNPYGFDCEEDYLKAVEEKMPMYDQYADVLKEIRAPFGSVEFTCGFIPSLRGITNMWRVKPDGVSDELFVFYIYLCIGNGLSHSPLTTMAQSARINDPFDFKAKVILKRFVELQGLRKLDDIVECGLSGQLYTEEYSIVLGPKNEKSFGISLPSGDYFVVRYYDAKEEWKDSVDTETFIKSPDIWVPSGIATAEQWEASRGQ